MTKRIVLYVDYVNAWRLPWQKTKAKKKLKNQKNRRPNSAQGGHEAF